MRQRRLGYAVGTRHRRHATWLSRRSGSVWSVEPVEFVRRHPRLFHLAHGDAWPSLAEHGLLSVQSLAERAGMNQAERAALSSQLRQSSVALTVPGFQSVVLRDQRPLNLIKLQGCLTGGMTVPEWLALLNSFVFLFPSQVTLSTLYEKYRSEPVLVVTLDTQDLVTEYGSLIRLSSINTGATVYSPARRGRDTFQGIAQFDPKRQVKEVAVMEGIPDLMRYVRGAEQHLPNGTRVPLRVPPGNGTSR